ncbi:Peroxisome biosynthesis protein pex1 [Elasticomyces elasticus]|nr:Peroxisome biosynthesis protein pex1 [Elasticomyces elasticus]
MCVGRRAGWEACRFIQSLCGVLNAEGIAGGIVRIDPAPMPLPKTASALKEHPQQAGKDAIIKHLRITPFIATQAAKKSSGFKFGSESKAERGEAAQRIELLFGKAVLDGPLTEGMLLPALPDWPGGVLDFDPTPPGDPAKPKTHWLIGGDRKLDIAVQPEIARPELPQAPGEPLPELPPRLIRELLLGIVRQFCGREGGVVLLATAAGKEAVNVVVVGGHVVRDIVGLKSPSKDGRRQVLETLVGKAKVVEEANRHGEEGGDGSEWMDGGGRPVTADGSAQEERMLVDPELDLLEIAGQTDGYMPGDLHLLVSRARSEALIRAVGNPAYNVNITLTAADFASALAGFTPASLRGVTLHFSTTTFASIGGLKETRATLLETLQYPTTYAPLFAKCPSRLRSGLLLYGYPGCGKTMLVSAVAGECGLNFISVKGPEILNKYIGASEKSVRDLFDRAQAARPAALFFDEFDSIAPRRGHDSTGVTDRMVNMLLTMMDGAEGLSGVYVLAATSRPDLIDPALLRPGRLDKNDRLDILRAVSKKLHVEEGVFGGEGRQTLEEVAERTGGYSGADLQAVMYNAHLEAIHDVLGKDSGADDDFGKKKTVANGAVGGKGELDFTYFRLGEACGRGLASGEDAPSLAAVASERAQIATKLSALQLARRKAKQDRRTQPASRRPSSAAGQQTNGKPKENAETIVTIGCRHLQKSLETTRSSISAQEHHRLAKIYKEFVVGRNGEMSDGQGGTEVGGRTSLI